MLVFFYIWKKRFIFFPLALVYRGEILNKNKKISEYISNPDLACIYITEQQELKFQKGKDRFSQKIFLYFMKFRASPKIRNNITG